MLNTNERSTMSHERINSLAKLRCLFGHKMKAKAYATPTRMAYAAITKNQFPDPANQAGIQAQDAEPIKAYPV